jgi:hypothetical protein
MLDQLVTILDAVAVTFGVLFILSVPVWIIGTAVGGVLDAVHHHRMARQPVDPETALWAESLDRGFRGRGES